MFKFFYLLLLAFISLFQHCKLQHHSENGHILVLCLPKPDHREDKSKLISISGERQEDLV